MSDSEISQSPPQVPDTVPRLRWWMALNYLNLDAPLVAVAWLALFAACRDVFVPLEAYYVLGIAVWCVYTIDHLADTRRSASIEALTPRHRFHRLAKLPMTGLLAIVMLLGGYITANHLPQQLVFAGLVLAGLILLYLIHARAISETNSMRMPKELLCGLIFAIGTSLPALIYGGALNRLQMNSLLAPIVGLTEIVTSPDVLFFGLLCSLNCVAIAVWEWQPGRVNDAAAITRFVPAVREHFTKLVLILLGGSLAFPLTINLIRVLNLGSPGFPPYFTVFFSCIAGSTGLIGLVHWQRHRFKPDVLRMLADLALLTPLAAIPFIPQSIWSLLKIAFGIGWD